MPFALTIDIVPPKGGRITAPQLTFYADTDEEAYRAFHDYAGTCDFVGAALKDGRIEEALEEIDPEDWPEYDD